MQAIRLPRILFAVWLTMVVWACAIADEQTPWHAHKGVVDAFYAKSLKERISTFPRYSFDDQYAIYLFGNQVQHPPAIYLADPFAARGQSIVLALSDRLKAATYDLTIRDIVMVFSAMSRDKTYNVVGDERLMKLLRESAKRMKKSGWKQIVEKEISGLKDVNPPPRATSTR
jgi:DNA topoisomerase IA